MTDSRSGVRESRTPKRAAKTTETTEYLRFMRRILRAAKRRVGAGDIDALAELVKMRNELDMQIQATVADLRGEPWCYSWQQIADALKLPRSTVRDMFPLAGGARKAGGQPSHLR